MNPDFINGMFEMVAGCLLWWNVWALYNDKIIKGVRVLPTFVFMLWGYWNLYYYPYLNQLWSFVGGINVVTANTVWVLQMIYYGRKK